MSCIDGRPEDAVAAVDTEEILAVMAWGTGDSKWGDGKTYGVYGNNMGIVDISMGETSGNYTMGTSNFSEIFTWNEVIRG